MDVLVGILLESNFGEVFEFFGVTGGVEEVVAVFVVDFQIGDADLAVPSGALNKIQKQNERVCLE
jgi:hypothetical protein